MVESVKRVQLQGVGHNDIGLRNLILDESQVGKVLTPDEDLNSILANVTDHWQRDYVGHIDFNLCIIFLTNKDCFGFP